MSMNEASTGIRSGKLSDAASAVRVLRSASAHVEHLLARALEPHDLTSAQYFVLEVMDEVKDKEEAIACSELGRRLSGPSPDVTRLLDRLESGGLVARFRDQKDRRVVHTRITPSGVGALEGARADVQRAEEQAMADLPPESRRLLASLLSDVQRRCPGS